MLRTNLCLFFCVKIVPIKRLPHLVGILHTRPSVEPTYCCATHLDILGLLCDRSQLQVQLLRIASANTCSSWWQPLILLLSKELLLTKVGQNRACLKARSIVARFGKRSRSKRSAKAVLVRFS